MPEQLYLFMKFYGSFSSPVLKRGYVIPGKMPCLHTSIPTTQFQGNLGLQLKQLESRGFYITLTFSECNIPMLPSNEWKMSSNSKQCIFLPQMLYYLKKILSSPLQIEFVLQGAVKRHKRRNITDGMPLRFPSSQGIQA